MNDALKNIHQRRSIGKLDLPIPSQDELATVLKAAMCAPDHKQLKPWQFVVMTGQALDEFGQVLLKAGVANAEMVGTLLDDATRNKLVNQPKRAPMIIMVATRYQTHEKVPEFEQLLSAGAMIQTLLLALKSLGYDSVWRTGELANHPVLKAHFGVADQDVICGLIYVGTSAVTMPARENSDLWRLVRFFE